MAAGFRRRDFLQTAAAGAEFYSLAAVAEPVVKVADSQRIRGGFVDGEAVRWLWYGRLQVPCQWPESVLSAGSQCWVEVT